jgi:penicillin-binding protein 2
MLALAALETGATNLTRRTFCRGFYTLPGSTHRYRDWKPQGHGQVDLHDAISQSCDVYFYEISREIGIDNMHTYLTQFGLGSETGIDIVGEKQGLVPSREWKRQAFSDRPNQVWFPGETIITSIGQGYMLATPLQLAHATATLAMRGKRFRPHIVAASENPITGERDLTLPEALPGVEIANDFYWDSVIAAMHAVMQSETGTARASGLGAPYAMAGKSGTAQVFSVAQEEKYNEKDVAERLRDHALFIAFAPLDDPRIAVAVVVENGSSGSRVAAPIARNVMDQYLGFGDAI